MISVSQLNSKKTIYGAVNANMNMRILQSVVDVLRIPAPLPPVNKDHPLGGNWIGRRECHIKGDWLLIYHVVENELRLDRTGTHTDLFGL